VSHGKSPKGNAGAPAGQAGERGIRQRRYWEQFIRYEGDFAGHVDCIHFNPVQHSHVPRTADWPHSSIHRYIEAAMIDRDGGNGICENDKRGYGERE
jgi:putative transposase